MVRSGLMAEKGDGRESSACFNLLSCSLRLMRKTFRRSTVWLQHETLCYHGGRKSVADAGSVDIHWHLASSIITDPDGLSSSQARSIPPGILPTPRP